MEPTIDVRAAIAAHPWRAVALAFAAGAYLALGPPRSATGRWFAAMGATTLGALRQLAHEHAAGYARSWLDQRLRTHAPATG